MTRLFHGLLLSVLWLLPTTAFAQHSGKLYHYMCGDEAHVSTTIVEEKGCVLVRTIQPIASTKHAKSERRKGKLEERAEPYVELVTAIASSYDLEPAFVMAIIAAESHFDPDATSTVGAMGLMQIMPSIAEHFGADDPYDPAQNIDAGCQLLVELFERYDSDVSLVLAAYSAGGVHVKNHGGVPPFCLPYIARVVRLHARLTHLW